MIYQNFRDVREAVNRNNPIPISIANAQDPNILSTVKQALDLNLIIPHLVGNEELILSMANKIDLDLSKYKIYDTRNDEESAFISAELASTGVTNAIMKGMINSTPFLKGILNKKLELVEHHQLLSHIATFEIPNFNRLVYMTDGGLNISPNLDQLKQIINNAISFLHDIGLANPKVALLSANERVDTKMPVTVEFKKINDIAHNEFKNAVVEGPLSLDIAINQEALSYKKIPSKIGGEADLLVVPNIESGNILGKSIVYMANGVMAGLVLGAKVPIILNSRSDSQDSKLSSIALTNLMYRGNKGVEDNG